MKWRSEEVRIAGLGAGVISVAAASHEDRPRWFLVTQDGRVLGVDLDDGATFFETKLPFSLDDGVTLSASPNGKFLAVVQTNGVQGALYEVPSGRLAKTLERGDYHPEVSAWAIALTDDRLFIATDWNRLEVWSLPSCERIRPAEAATKFDYFWGRAELSPSKRWLASFGWHWHPIGVLQFVDVEAWLANGEREDGRPPVSENSLPADWWDASVCFLDDRRIALIGDRGWEEKDMLQSQSGLLIYDFVNGVQEAYFPGLLARELAFDGERLLLLGDTTRAVSPHDGSILATLETKTVAWHLGNRSALSLEPFAQHWLSGALDLQLELPRSSSPAELSVLADSLEERGADSRAIAHLRQGGPHGRRCWVTESLTCWSE